MEVCSNDLELPNTVLLKLVGNKCNLNCTYCSEKIKNIKSKPIDINEIYHLIDNIPLGTDIILHGGEPTIVGMENLQNIINYIVIHDPDRTPSIQTNGFLSVEWADFFLKNKNKIRIGISIDGPDQANILRIQKNGSSTFETINAFIQSLDDRKIEYKCIATINKYNCKEAIKFMDYFAQLKYLRHLQLNPCFDFDESSQQLKDWSVRPKNFLNFCNQCFLYWIQDSLYEKFELRPFTETIKNITKTQRISFHCYKYLSLYPGGFYRFCDIYNNSPDIIFNSEIEFNEENLKNTFKYEIEDCKHCDLLENCNTGCPVLKTKFRKNNELLQEYCEYKIGIHRTVQNLLNYKGDK